MSDIDLLNISHYQSQAPIYIELRHSDTTKRLSCRAGGKAV